MVKVLTGESPALARFSPAFYNETPDVKVADTAIAEEERLDRAKHVLHELFGSHGVLSRCGFTLLHSHWTVDDDEIPEQVRVSDESGTRLVTRPVKPSRRGNSVPASWAVARRGDEAELVALEFTADRFAGEAVRQLSGMSDFFEDAVTALVRHDLDRWFGLCVPVREAVSDDRRAGWVEVTEPDRRSVVTARTLTADEAASSVQTVWIFEGEGEAVCQTACFAETNCLEGAEQNPDGSWSYPHTVQTGKHQKQHEVGPA